MNVLALKNFSWMSFGQVFINILRAFVIIAIARYVGVENYGALSFAIVASSIAKISTTLGMQNIIIRGVLERTKPKNFLFNAFLLQVFSAFVFFILVIVITGMYIDDHITKVLIYIFSISILFQPFQVIAYYFEAKLEQRFVTMSLISATVIGSVLKFLLIYFEQGIEIISSIYLLEYLISAFVLCYYYFSKRNLEFLRFDLTIVKNIIKDSWPYFFGAFAVMLYTYTDIVMIRHFLTLSDVGSYSVAARIADMWHIIPISIASTALPFLFKEINISADKEYKNAFNFQFLHNIMVYLSLIWILCIYLIGDGAILFLFGEEYKDATKVILLFSFISLFYALGIASSKWYLLMGLQKLTLYRNLFGAIVNILLNINLIPKYGILGAAYGTLISYIAANYLYDFFNPKTRILFTIKTKSILLMFLLRDFRLFLKFINSKLRQN